MKLKNIVVMVIMILSVVILVPKSNASALTIAFSKSTANVGDKVNVTVNGNGIAGKISLSVSGSATLSQNSVWVDNSSATVTLSINGTGNITVTANPVDASDSTTANPFTTSTSGTVKVAEQTPDKPATQPAKPTTIEKSNVATLSNLGIKPNDFSGFKANTYSYKVEVPNETEKIEVYASPAKGQENKQKISGTGTKTLKEGVNTFEVVVTAETGNAQKYTINVTRKAKEETEEPKQPEEPEETLEEPMEEAFGLTELNIEGLKLEPQFQTDIYEYKIELKEDLEKLNLTTLATEANSNIEIVGNENLKEGENIITIIVKGTDEEKTATYQIVVNKKLEEQEDTANQEQDHQQIIKKIIAISVAGGLILIIVISVVFIKTKKSKESANQGYIPYENVIDNYEENEVEEQNDYNNEEDGFYEEVPKKKKRSKGKRFK